MEKKVLLPLFISFGLVVICMVGSLLAHLIDFPTGTEQFLSGFELALGSLIGSIATILAGRERRNDVENTQNANHSDDKK
jgi:uncharacterized membrane protein YphA (DoxX/SURF4 family)